MDTTTRAGTLMRQRMLDDMRMCMMPEHTQDGYVRAVLKLAGFLGRSPDTATIEDLRRFQLLGGTLVSNNTREFERVPRLKVENWAA